MKNSILLFLFIHFFFAFACSQPGFKTIKIDEFERDLNENSSIQLIDVRTKDEYNLMHIENAVLIDINGSDFEKMASFLDKSKPVYVYCLSGGRSKRASQWFVNQGFTSVVNLDGGISQWEAAGKKLTRSNLKINDKISSVEYKKIINSNDFVLISMNAKWCAPCQKMKSEIANLKKINSTISITIIEATENPELIKQNKVVAYPTIIIYKSGNEVLRSTGFLSTNDLNSKLLSIK